MEKLSMRKIREVLRLKFELDQRWRRNFGQSDK